MSVNSGVLKHMELCKARGTVILSLWKSSCFWTLFCSDGVHWNSSVVDWVFLPKFPGLSTRGKARNTLFGSRLLDFDVVALRIDFRCHRSPSLYLGFCTLCSKNCELVFSVIALSLLHLGYGLLVITFPIPHVLYVLTVKQIWT